MRTVTLERRKAETTIVCPGGTEAYWLVTDMIQPLISYRGKYDVVYAEVASRTGPPPHIHRREDELFYVLEGTFDITFGRTTRTIGAGDAIFLPRGVVHGFVNVSETTGKLLVMATPANLIRFVSGTGEICLDAMDLPQVTPKAIEHLAAGCARAGIELVPTWKADAPAMLPAKPQELWCIGLHIKLLLTSEQTNGQFSVAEIIAEPGMFVPPHTHKTEDEFFYVVEGEFEFDLGDRTIAAPAGTFVHVPKQMIHGFRNASERTAKLFDCHTPGGFEKFFMASGTPCKDFKKGPPNAPINFPKFVEICKAHGMELAG